MSDYGNCCAHKRVVHNPHEVTPGHFSDRWNCDMCGFEFRPFCPAEEAKPAPESVYERARIWLRRNVESDDPVIVVEEALLAGEAAEKNYRWMVEHAADQKLDGYRELASKLCAAEERAEAAEKRAEKAEAHTQRAITIADETAGPLPPGKVEDYLSALERWIFQARQRTQVAEHERDEARVRGRKLEEALEAILDHEEQREIKGTVDACVRDIARAALAGEDSK